jgi:hypothetical protein
LYGKASPIWKNPGWSSCGSEASEEACARTEGQGRGYSKCVK